MSERTVIPLYLYLDERHLEWMSDKVLQYVITDLRPLIIPKLKAEAETQHPSSGKKSTVGTHRGDFYQFCYFVRNTEPHSLVIKTRRFVAALPQAKLALGAMQPKPAPGKGKGKRKAPSTKKASTRKKQKKVQKPPHNKDDDIDDEIINISDSDDDDMYEPEEGLDSDESMDEGAPADRAQPGIFDTGFETEEEKPKPLVRLNYHGFNISGQCICVIVEPWPVVRDPQASKGKENPFTRAFNDTAQQVEQSKLAVAPSRPTPGPQAREVPLFLPEEDDVDVNPMPTLQGTSKLYTMDEEDDDIGSFDGMMAFSQALNIAGDHRPGATDEDGDMDGSVLFADADEIKEL